MLIVTSAPDMKHSHWGMIELSELNLCTLIQQILTLHVCASILRLEGIKWMSGAKSKSCKDANAVSPGNQIK